jgi:20S proteasome alpha/beta subunit
MTIAAGFRCQDGVVLCSDSQYTGADKQSRDKIIPHLIGNTRITFVLTGDEDYARSTVYDVHQELARLAQEKHSVLTIREIVREAVSKMSTGYDLHDNNAENKPQFLVAVSTKNEAVQLFSARENSVPPVSDCTCLGTGGYIARYIDKAFGPVFRKSMEDTLLIAIYMLTAARKHDVYCGGGIQFHFMSPLNVSAGYTFEWGPEDQRISQLEGQFGRIIEGIGTFSDQNFERRMAEFNNNIGEIRRLLISPESSYLSILRQIRSISPQASPSPQSPKGDPSRQPPSPGSPGGSGES